MVPPALIFGLLALVAVLVMLRVSAAPVDPLAPISGETRKRTELRLVAEAARAAAAAEADDTMACPRCAEKNCRLCQPDLEAWRAEKASAS